ncbi:MAG TPA: hypothetical protein VMF30_13425, partial [Pirellulales bacterium]|nr:hypothetical protein [Pirellulales bacterium]
MGLLKRCINDFDQRDRRRGAEYFKRGAVCDMGSRLNGFEASVFGSSNVLYDVRLDWSAAAAGVLV